MNKRFLTLAAGTALLSVSACVGGGSDGPRGPDEFRVVTKAPLTIPPEFNLRPPQAGQALPVEVDPSRVDSATAFGTTIGSGASASERALVATADANAVSQVIRSQIDYEETKTIRKSNSVSDRLMFWKGDEEGAVEDSATGGEEVIIERGSGDRLKLPGT